MIPDTVGVATRYCCLHIAVVATHLTISQAHRCQATELSLSQANVCDAKMYQRKEYFAVGSDGGVASGAAVVRTTAGRLRMQAGTFSHPQ